MYQNNLSPNYDQPARVDATRFAEDANDIQIDLHASNLEPVSVIQARQAIADALQVSQVEHVPTRDELNIRIAFQATSTVRTNRRIYNQKYIDLKNDEQPEYDMFKDAA